MRGNLLEELITWQQQGRRSVEIRIENSGEMKIWVYDYDLLVGQFITSTDEINLEGKKIENEKAEYERLKKKFGEAM
ncbi:hypothetical protein [Thermotalea metallivorans]|uniref:Uncharacterized protein n=1 Tax=Thermotalea metallivorans TaxID=520762 RepID=A0A140LCI5_9FIRM|nr:hypothetical protein [Thermotalea metallivorans]KXG78260.1 hypothetical protein AN619_02350 [Thermotalea metallivorans]